MCHHSEWPQKYSKRQVGIRMQHYEYVYDIDCQNSSDEEFENLGEEEQEQYVVTTR